MPASAARPIQARPSTRIRGHAAALGQHEAIPILGVDHTPGGDAEPFGGAAVIALHPHALGQADAVIESGHQVARGGGFLEPLAGAHRVLGCPLALQHQGGEVVFGVGVAGLGGNAEPPRRLGGVARHARAGQVQHAERAGGLAVAGLGGDAEPHRRFGMIGRQLAAAGVDVADDRRGFAVAAQGGATQPGLAGDPVLLDAAALHQRQAPARLRGAHPLLGRFLVQGNAARDVFLDALPLFGEHAEQVLGSRQARFGGTGDFPRTLGELLRGAGVAQHCQPEAQPPLRAVGRRRAAVDRLGRIKVAHFLRTRGQDVAQQRLAVGRAGIGGPARPVGGALEIGFGRLVLVEQRRRRAAGGQIGGLAGRHRGGAAGDAVHIQRRQQRLRLDIILRCGAFQPAGALDRARGHAGAFEVAAPDLVLGLRQLCLGGLGEQPEGVGPLALPDKPSRPLQRHGGQFQPTEQTGHRVQNSVQAVTPGMAPPRARPTPRPGRMPEAAEQPWHARIVGRRVAATHRVGRHGSRTLSMATGMKRDIM